MKKLSGNEVRQLFLAFFKAHGHMVEPGASLIPVNDPSLLWINAGVAALKKYFDGREKPRCPRICNAQKSIRTNDIENVGKTARHHTFFEMLGNFSIGDYFKEEALTWAWEFLTSPDWIGFDPNRLYVTVYPADDEAYRIWTEVIKINPQHILKTNDNFWEIGEGPCGPDSEIFYDRGEQYDPEHLGEKLFFEELENDRYIEVWNIVFSQFDAKEGVKRADYAELPQKNIDTGMGLERLVSLIQEGETNFDTDLFLPYIEETAKYAKYPYEGKYKMAYRVIADHIRTCTFALADGAIFANEGRGYVLRRVLRRAVRYARTLGIEEAFMYKLVDSVCLNMQSFYPYLEAKKDFIKTLIKKEEELFLATLTNGEKLLNEALAQVKDQTLAGETVFKLYDTYGFPKEITAEVCADRGIKCDLQGFEQCMAKQKEMARSSRNAQESMHNQAEDLLNFTAPFKFRGYEEDTCLATVSGIFKNGCALNELTDSGEIALSQTVFYAESGGQCADHGYLENADFRAEVLDVQKAPHGQFLHHVKVLKGKVKSDDMLTATIDRVRRQKIRANHSSLHLLQAALRQILGKHIAQAGSFVSDSYARFDFTHFAKITATDLAKIEALVNSWIMAEIPITTTVMKLEEAKKLPAIALFDEKYEDYVRVVEMGTVSLEFCGGTHAANTQDLGVFKINSEESIGSGIRRIECQTKYCAYANYAAQVEHLNAIAESLKVKAVAAIDAKLKALLNENSQLNLELKRAKEKLINLEATEVLEKAVIINGLKCLLLKLDHSEIKLKDYALTLRNKLGEGLVFIADIFDDKITFAAALSSSAIAKGYKAGEIIRLAAALSEGKGGGRADLAQGGGKNCGNIEIIFKALKEYLTNIPHA